MKIYLVRNGQAIKRTAWTGWDDLRPLTAKGENQARGLQATLESVAIRRIWSSPAIRCHETVERLAGDRSLLVELDSRLDEESGVEDALALLDEEAGAPVLLCAGRSLIGELLATFQVGDGDPGDLLCQKGSVWMLERRGHEITSAEYMAPREIRGKGAHTHRRAVLDIGSASISLLVADVRRSEGRVEPVLRERRSLRFGASLGEIDAEECERAAKGARLMQAEAMSVGSEDLLPVATAGLRNATNGQAVADQIGAALAMPVRMLSGAQEARFVYTASRIRLGIDKEPVVALDLGGGSLDLAAGRGAKPHYEASEPLGVTRLHAELVHTDPMDGLEAEAIRERVSTQLSAHVDRLRVDEPRCIAAGGTVRALARLVQASRGRADLESVRGLTISRSELGALSVRLRAANHKERMKMPTVRPRRVDLLPTSAIILMTVLEQLDLAEMTVSDWGLREGVLLEKAPQG